MKKIYLYIPLFCILLSFAGCDTEGEVVDTGFITTDVNLVWKADNTASYKLTLDGDTVKSQMHFSRDKKKAMLRAFKNNETTPELEEEVTLENNKRIELIQLPGSKISFYKASEETDPSSEHNVKLRLFYSTTEGWGKSVKVDIWAKAGRRGEHVPTNISMILKEGKLSDYTELNLNYFLPDNEGSPKFYAEITDVETGKQLADQFDTRIGIGSMGEFDSNRGYKNEYKLVTAQLSIDEFSTSFVFISGLCTPW